MTAEIEHEPLTCELCGAELEWQDCDACGGAGMFDCYEDDPINYEPGQEYETCSECDGNGGWWWCPTRHAESEYAT